MTHRACLSGPVLYRVLPLALVIAFLVLGVGMRVYLHRRRTGRSGVMLFRDDRKGQWLRDAMVLTVPLGHLLQALANAVAPQWLAPIVLPFWPASSVIFYGGAIVVASGVVLMFAAQGGLGPSWRIGIDESSAPGLVDSGFYAFCRNPIFAAAMLCLVGLIAVVPTWFSLVALVGTLIGVRQQVREEEAYLVRTYGDAYRNYARRVGRFFPGVGLLE